jgi:branched-chain amino acid transport system permease protein
MSLFGGIGTLIGPLLGALVLESLQQYFTLQFSSGDLYLVIYGALFLAVLLWLPRGIIPTGGDWLKSLAKRRRPTATAGGSDPAVTAVTAVTAAAADPAIAGGATDLAISGFEG